MATTVATNYGMWWTIDGTIANVGKWLRDNTIMKGQIQAMAYDGTSGQICVLVHCVKTGLTTQVT